MQTYKFRWDDLRLFLAVYRKSSLKSAALELGVNISTVARRLNALEEDLKTHLFDRNSEGTQPSIAAEELLSFAEDMEQAALQLGRAVDGLDSEPEGMVRITAPPGIVDHFLAQALPKLLADNPKLRVDILSTSGYADLTRREADIALRSRRPTSGDLVSTQLGRSEYVLVGAPSLNRELGQLHSLNDVYWVTYSDESSHLPEVSWVASHVDPDQILLRANSFTAQLQAVRSGVGVKLVAEPFLRLDGVSEVKLSADLVTSLGPLPTTSLWLVGHRALRNVPRIAAVWSFLVDTFREPSQIRD